jgi:hypothetical protein
MNVTANYRELLMLARAIVTAIGFAGALLSFDSSAVGQHRIVAKPDPGTEAVATIGSPILERFDMPVAAVTKALTISEDIHVSLGIQGKIDIPAGSALEVVKDRPLKACTVAQDTYSDRVITTSRACLYDRDMDGRFDRTDAEAFFTGRNPKQPVAYAFVDVPVHVGGSDFRQTLTYLGTTAGVLRISYREFSGDVARPAFTEELTFPLEKSFPQTIRWRETTITLLGITPDGLRYRIEP